MSREIKFRVVSHGRVIGYESLIQGRWHWKALPGRRWRVDTAGLFNLRNADSHRDQYTGLKDKKMHEVWEGDIGTYYFGLEKRIGYVRYYAGRWIVDSNSPGTKTIYVGFDLSDIFDGILWDRNEHPFEVIGNIWENKDILNDSK